MMREAALNLFKSNCLLEGYLRKTGHLQSQTARRRVVRIAVIDDQPFAPHTNLQSYGYVITPIGDLKSLDEIAAYPLILCDIMGVGRHFDNKLQGASIIAEIKRSHPEKVVIAYTGAGLNEKAARVATERADHIIKKDADIEEWIDELDHFSEQAVDPFIIWNKLRQRFIEMNVPTRDILLLEDRYVRSVLSNDSKMTSLTTIPSKSIQPDVRAIIQNLVASLIFQAILAAPK